MYFFNKQKIDANIYFLFFIKLSFFSLFYFIHDSTLHFKKLNKNSLRIQKNICMCIVFIVYYEYIANICATVSEIFGWAN